MNKYFSNNDEVENIIDSFLFIGSIFFTSIFIVNGKNISSSIFHGEVNILNPKFYNPSVFVLFLACGIFYDFLRNSNFKQGVNIILSGLGGLLFAASSFIYEVSILVFFLLLYLYIVVSEVVVVTPYIKTKDVGKEFWKIMIDLVFGVMRFSFILFVASLALLRFVSGGTNEPTIGFISTVFYPTIVFIVGHLIIGYWVILPCWDRLFSGYRKESHMESMNSFKERYK